MNLLFCLGLGSRGNSLSKAAAAIRIRETMRTYSVISGENQ
jgi:hypothetical protein